MLQTAAIAEFIVCWFAWSLAFMRARRRSAGQEKVVRAPVSKWGITLQVSGYAMAWAYIRPAGFHKPPLSLIAGMIMGPPLVALAWAATRHLGKQWRYEAALSSDHELVQTGPYGCVRHPIYASMLGMLLATGAIWTWWPMLVAALATFLTGTEIRVRAEERLLAQRFQQAFSEYRSKVPAYIPFVR